MKIIRWFIGKIILFFDVAFAPRQPLLSSEEQKKRADFTARLSLYQYEACPFCVKVRRFMRASGLQISLVDAKQDPGKKELREGGGKIQVPCLKIREQNGNIRWLYESQDIISFLRSGIEQ